MPRLLCHDIDEDTIRRHQLRSSSFPMEGAIWRFSEAIAFHLGQVPDEGSLAWVRVRGSVDAFSAEVFARLLGNPPRCDGPMEPWTDWALALHIACDGMPAFPLLRDSCCGDADLAAIATATFLDTLLDELANPPEPDQEAEEEVQDGEHQDSCDADDVPSSEDSDGDGGVDEDDVIEDADNPNDDGADDDVDAGGDAEAESGDAGDDADGEGGEASDDADGEGGEASDDADGEGGEASDADGEGGEASDDADGEGGEAGDDAEGEGGGDDADAEGEGGGDDAEGEGGDAGDDAEGEGGGDDADDEGGGGDDADGDESDGISGGNGTGDGGHQDEDGDDGGEADGEDTEGDEQEGRDGPAPQILVVPMNPAEAGDALVDPGLAYSLSRAVEEAVRAAMSSVEDAYATLLLVGAGRKPGEVRIASDEDPERLHLLEELATNHRLQEAVDQLGRLVKCFEVENRSRSIDTRDEVVGVESGDDLFLVLPEEIVRLLLPEARAWFLRDYVERELPQLQHEGREPLVRGDMVVLVDESGSMGEKDARPEAFAHAAAAFVVKYAVSQGRAVHVLPFTTYVSTIYSVDRQGRVFCSSHEVATVGGLISEILRRRSDGGTLFDGPLSSALDFVRGSSADVLIVTDGQSSISPHVLARLDRLRETEGLRLFAFTLNGGHLLSLGGVADQIIDLDRVEDDAVAVVRSGAFS
jgi:hypothetical protein